MKAYRIRAWNTVHEKSDTRKCESLSWVSVPLRHDTSGFRRLMKQPDGAAMYGAYLMMVEVSGKLPRSMRGWLVSREGVALDAESLSLKTGAPEELFQKTLEFLSTKNQGWIELDEFCLSTLPARPEILPPPDRTGPDRTLHNRTNTGTGCAVDPVGENPPQMTGASESRVSRRTGPDRRMKHPTERRSAWIAKLSQAQSPEQFVTLLNRCLDAGHQLVTGRGITKPEWDQQEASCTAVAKTISALQNREEIGAEIVEHLCCVFKLGSEAEQPWRLWQSRVTKTLRATGALTHDTR